jgi:hypothetical protein
LSDPKIAAAIKATCPKCNGDIRQKQLYQDTVKGKVRS